MFSSQSTCHHFRLDTVKGLDFALNYRSWRYCLESIQVITSMKCIKNNINKKFRSVNQCANKKYAQKIVHDAHFIVHILIPLRTEVYDRRIRQYNTVCCCKILKWLETH